MKERKKKLHVHYRSFYIKTYSSLLAFPTNKCNANFFFFNNIKQSNKCENGMEKIHMQHVLSGENKSLYVCHYVCIQGQVLQSEKKIYFLALKTGIWARSQANS